MDSSLELLKKNLEMWSFFCPDEAKKLETLDCQSIELIENPDGTKNLKKKETASYLHSPIDVMKESEDWFSNLNLHNVEVLYVYGIGLGYYYDTAKKWLQEKEDRFLVFLEDHLEVIRFFLESERASEFLQDKKVRLYYLDWKNLDSCLDRISSEFIFKHFKVSALYSYFWNERFHELNARLAYLCQLKASIMIEYVSYGWGFFHNFYRNLLLIPDSRQGNLLFNQFKGMPAIICGAGPSLQKNFSILKQMKDRALIFAGGTALNALNAQGFLPHFGVGIDPHLYQYSRIISNYAYEMPFFYRNRMNHEALRAVHGNRLYITGTGGYNISEWVEEQLGIEGKELLSEGYNVINFSLSIAHALGCNPIIFVGVDLAYSDNQSYAPGILYHAIHDPKQDFRTKNSTEELLIKNDINGEPVYTLWKWINESLWFSQFALDHRDVVLINSTEGGLGFPGISNVPLKEVAEKYLTKQLDLGSRLHGEIEQCQMPSKVSIDHVLEVLEALVRHLLECHEICREIGKEYFHMRFHLKETSPEQLISEEISRLQEQMKQNLAYRYLLEIFDRKHTEFFAPHFKRLEYEGKTAEEKENIKKKLDLWINHYRFLQATAETNLKLIEMVLKNYLEKARFGTLEVPQTTLSLLEKLKSDRTDQAIRDKYSFHNQILTIIDAELGISFQEKFEPPQETEDLIFYSDGKLKLKHYYDKNLLHGPSTFFSKEGRILALGWYIHGKQQGKAWYYYSSGGLYSLQRFKDGLWHGRQEFYYPNGLPKSILHYTEGSLDGKIQLFYPDGKIKRELHFSKGKRHGSEKLWNELGLLSIEAEYQDDKPVGVAREWYENGNISKEIIYDADHQKCTLKRWDEWGKPWKPEMLVQEDYFDKVTKQSEVLTQSLDNIVAQLQEVTQFLPQDLSKKGLENHEIQNEFEQLQKEMDHLHKVSEEMVFESGLNPNNPNEPLWKSESVQREIQQKLEIVTKKMSRDIVAMQEVLDIALRMYKEQKKLDEEKNE